jgi:hypothetical protein
MNKEELIDREVERLMQYPPYLSPKMRMQQVRMFFMEGMKFAEKYPSKELVSHLRFPTEWISVKELLPRPNEEVMVWDCKRCIRFTAYISWETGEWESCYKDVSVPSFEIDYWMPLPYGPGFKGF